MKPISSFNFPFGISALFWLIVGAVRLVTELVSDRRGLRKRLSRPLYAASDIAVLIPAHNEELVITRCIRALKQSLPARQIFVASDGSTDQTYALAKRERCHVSKLNPGRGKARALVHLIHRHKLFRNYTFIFIVDADTQIDKHFVERALPLFNDPTTSVVFGSARIRWPPHVLPQLKLYYIAYRERLNRLLQYFFIYGQTWKYTNVNYVIPGFAVIYRSDILAQLQIDTPGLIIEDFNLAFQFHKKKLGKIGYNPECIGWDQHPDNLRDYCKQVRRWNIGFFQTVKKNGVWPSFFWLSLGVFSFEVLFHSLFILLLPLFLLLALANAFPFLHFLRESLATVDQTLGLFRGLTLRDVLFGVFFIDYIWSITIGLSHKKPQMLFYGLFFFFMHYVVSLVLLSAIIPGFFGTSVGKWISPKRHTIGQD